MSKKLVGISIEKPYEGKHKPGSFPTTRDAIDWSKSTRIKTNMDYVDIDLPVFSVVDGGK